MTEQKLRIKSYEFTSTQDKTSWGMFTWPIQDDRMNMTEKFTTTNINNGEHDQKIKLSWNFCGKSQGPPQWKKWGSIMHFIVAACLIQFRGHFLIETCHCKKIIYFYIYFLVMFNGNVRCCEFFGHVLMLMFVGVKNFWSCSNRNSVILIWSSKLASASSQVKPLNIQNVLFL